VPTKDKNDMTPIFRTIREIVKQHDAVRVSVFSQPKMKEDVFRLDITHHSLKLKARSHNKSVGFFL
jgi:hypothetical protein